MVGGHFVEGEHEGRAALAQVNLADGVVDFVADFAEGMTISSIDFCPTDSYCHLVAIAVPEGNVSYNPTASLLTMDASGALLKQPTAVPLPAGSYAGQEEQLRSSILSNRQLNEIEVAIGFNGS